MSDTTGIFGNDDPDLREITLALTAIRPSPTPSFRGRLARRITTSDPGYGPRPAGLWRRAGALMLAGGFLIVLGLLVEIGAV